MEIVRQIRGKRKCVFVGCAFSTWLFRVASNHTLDLVRRKKLRTLSLNQEVPGGNGDGLFLDVPARDPDPQQAYIRAQRQAQVQGLVVRLRYFEELSYEEIAPETRPPLRTVKAQLHRTRELLLAKGNRAAF